MSQYSNVAHLNFHAETKSEKCFISQVIAENLSADEIQGLKAMFQNMDTDKSGTITYEELKTGLARLGSKLTEAEVKQLMEAVRDESLSACFYLELLLWYSNFSLILCTFQADVDGNGTIDYIEFITATMHKHKLEREDNLYKAFLYFDKDGSG